MTRFPAAAFALLLTAAFANADVAAATPAPQTAILVTGASTGIGRKVTERLAADGYFVYAGARKEKDIGELSAKLDAALAKAKAAHYAYI